jgi:hypothetical protein
MGTELGVTLSAEAINPGWPRAKSDYPLPPREPGRPPRSWPPPKRVGLDGEVSGDWFWWRGQWRPM